MKALAALIVLAAGLTARGETVEEFRARMAANPPPANARSIPQQGRGLKKNQWWHQEAQAEAQQRRMTQEAAENARRIAEYQRQQVLIQQEILKAQQMRQMQQQLEAVRRQTQQQLRK